jgi:predicted nucleic acid-binding protein
MYVFDATSLIYLAKAERLDLVGNLPATCAVPDRVRDEVVTTGIEGGHADARRVERTVNGGVLPVDTVRQDETFDRLRRNDRLSEADCAVLALADKRGATAVMDERYGRDVAETEGIETRGTAYLVLRLLQEGVVDATVARETVDAMMDAGWYCAPDLYAKVTRKIDDLS